MSGILPIKDNTLRLTNNVFTYMKINDIYSLIEYAYQNVCHLTQAVQTNNNMKD